MFADLSPGGEEVQYRDHPSMQAERDSSVRYSEAVRISILSAREEAELGGSVPRGKRSTDEKAELSRRVPSLVRRLLLLCALALASCNLPTTVASSAVPVAVASTAPQTAAISTQEVLASVGVDSHFNYNTSPYATVPGIADTLGSLGAHGGLRDSTDNANTVLLYDRYGMKHSVSFNEIAHAANPQSVVAAATAAAGGCNRITHFETNNEADGNNAANFKPPYTNWADENVADQKALYIAAKAVCPHVPVVSTPLEDSKNAPAIAGELPYIDYISSHDSSSPNYPEYPNASDVAHQLAPLQAAFPNKRVWTTEWSYADYAPSDATLIHKLSDYTLARYEGRSIGYRFGYLHEARLFQYQAVRLPSDPVFGTTGILIDDKGKLLPAGLALRSLLTLLPSRGPFTNAKCAYSFSVTDAQTYFFKTYDSLTCAHYTWVWLGIQSGPKIGALPVPPAYPVTTKIEQLPVPVGDIAASWCALNATLTSMIPCQPLTILNGMVTVPVQDQVGVLRTISITRG